MFLTVANFFSAISWKIISALWWNVRLDSITIKQSTAVFLEMIKMIRDRNCGPHYIVGKVMSQIQWSAITFPTPIILLHIFQIARFTHNLHGCQKINSKFQREHGFSGVGIVMAPCHNFPTCEVAPIELKFRQYINCAIAYTILWTFNYYKQYKPRFWWIVYI